MSLPSLLSTGDGAPPIPSPMVTPSDTQSISNGGARVGDPCDLGDLFNQLDLDGEEFDDLEIDVDDPELNDNVCWLALDRVHTHKSFNQAAFFKEKRSSWNPT